MTTDAEAPLFDLLVIGGGINGAGIARDAAGRGLSVCLVEQDDLAAHTSSSSTKLIHGGLRYLEHGELRLVRESLAERERLLAIAPHIIRPMRFVLPYVDGLRPRWLLRLGLFVYDNIGRREKLAASQSLQLAGTMLGEPLLPHLVSGFGYSDCWVEDSRLVVLNVRDAVDRAATLRLHTQVESATSRDGEWAIQCRDRVTGMPHALRARTVVNATGAWVNEVLEKLGIAPRQHLRLVQGSHIVLRRLYEGDHAYLLQSPDQRVIFAIPFEKDYTLVGTTDQPFEGDPAQVAISAGERQYLLDTLARFFRRPVTAADICHEFSGVRPLFDDGQARAQSVSRDYQLELQHSAQGAAVLTVYGGKITTYRRLAEAAMEMLPAARAVTGPWTGSEALPGGDFADGDLAAFTARAMARWPLMPSALVTRMARLYGTRMALMLGDATRIEDLGRNFGSDLTGSEVRYLVETEWARSAEDILWRRTRLGLRFPASAVHDLQDAVAKLL